MPQQPAPEFEQDDTDHREDSTMIAAKAKVWFHDDDKTPVDFVMYVLEQFFGLDEPKAKATVDRIRKQGKAVVVEMPAIPAELARRRVAEAAADAGYPLKVEVEGMRIV